MSDVEHEQLSSGALLITLAGHGCGPCPFFDAENGRCQAVHAARNYRSCLDENEGWVEPSPPWCPLRKGLVIVLVDR